MTACESVVASAAAPPPVNELMTRVAARLLEYYRRAQSVICTNVSTVLPIDRDWTVDGMARTVESELRVESDASTAGELPEPRLAREIKRINGRAPQDRDKTDRSGCTDPNPLSPEPLAFLLPSHRDEYVFTAAKDGREHDRAAFVIDFASAARRSRLELIEDPGGHKDCFDWSGSVAMSGRVWVDAETYDVLKVERHLNGPVDIHVPSKLQRRYGFGDWVVLDRDDLTIHYRSVSFSDPDERLLLPASIDSMTVLRGGLQSIRRTDTFADYRRFVTSGRIK